MKSVDRAKEVIPGYDGLIYAHQLAITTGQCVKDLELIAKAAEPQDLANRVEFLPL